MRDHIAPRARAPYRRPTTGCHMAPFSWTICIASPTGGGHTYCACFRGQALGGAIWRTPASANMGGIKPGPARCAVWPQSLRRQFRLIWPAVWRLNPRKRLDPLHLGAPTTGVRAPHYARRGRVDGTPTGEPGVWWGKYLDSRGKRCRTAMRRVPQPQLGFSREQIIADQPLQANGSAIARFSSGSHLLATETCTIWLSAMGHRHG